MTSSRQRNVRAAVLVAVALVLAGPASAATSPSTWRSEYGNARNTGYNGDESVLDAAAVKTLGIDWGNRGPGLGSFTPIVGAKRTFVPCEKGLCALDGNGQEKWSAPSPGIPSPAVADGVVFATVGSHPVTLAAMRAADGAELWRRTFAHTGSMYASPVWFDGTLYVSTDNGDLYALNAATGRTRWSKRFEFSASVPVAVTAGRVYAVSDSDYSRLRVLRRDTGEVLWTGASQYRQAGAPVVAHGKVYVSAMEDGVIAFDADGCGHETCYPVWQPYTPDGAEPFTLAVDTDRIYTVDRGARLRVYSAERGALLWSGSGRGHDPQYGVIRPVVANGVVYVADGLRLRAYRARGCPDRACGPIWKRSRIGDHEWPYEGLSVADGRLYAIARFRLERFAPQP